MKSQADTYYKNVIKRKSMESIAWYALIHKK